MLRFGWRDHFLGFGLGLGLKLGLGLRLGLRLGLGLELGLEFLLRLELRIRIGLDFVSNFCGLLVRDVEISFWLLFLFSIFFVSSFRISIRFVIFLVYCLLDCI
jgi:hypothetical protein